jgi:hypothetical protein
MFNFKREKTLHELDLWIDYMSKLLITSEIINTINSKRMLNPNPNLTTTPTLTLDLNLILI